MQKDVEFECPCVGPIVMKRLCFHDERGCLTELFQTQKLAECGVEQVFVQDNFSRSAQGVIRGLHYQLRSPQAKLVTILSGTVLDVGVDLRRSSPSFGRWFSVELSEENARVLYLPEGFAHGFSVQRGPAEVLYKCSDVYDPSDQYGLRWDDPRLTIDWKCVNPQLSEKDQNLPTLEEISEEHLPD